MAPSEVEIAWAAGLLEGEAWFGHSGNSACLVIAMVDRDVVAKYAAIFDLQTPRPVPPPKNRPNRQMQWGVGVRGRRALEIMRIVLPHLGERRSAKVREVEKLMAEKYDPRPCAECGELFVAKPRAPLSQRFCGTRCQSRSKKRRRRKNQLAELGLTPEDRCGVTTPDGDECRNWPKVGHHRCRHHLEVA